MLLTGDRKGIWPVEVQLQQFSKKSKVNQKVDYLIQVNMNKVVINIIQDSAVTQTVLGGLTTYHISSMQWLIPP